MSNKGRKRLVIDASIARAAGGPDATFPVSKQCRDFLQDVLTICHRVVLTDELNTEWRRHQSTFARRWLTSMYARKKVHWDKENKENTHLRARIESVALSEATNDAMQKDCHLLEAALATDDTIASLDERVRQLFGNAAKSIAEIQPIIWVNPTMQDEHCEEWLANGAESEFRRRLDNQLTSR